MGRFSKMFAASATSVAILAGGVSAQGMCLFPSGDCWPSATAKCNEDWGWVFNGGTQGVGTYCEGGTYDQSSTTNRKNEPLPNPSQTLQGCCYWSSSNTYANVFTETGVGDCKTGTNKWWLGEDCADAVAPTRAPDWPVGEVTVYGYCQFAEDTTGGCWAITSADEGYEGKVAVCHTGANIWWEHPKAPPANGVIGACPTSTPDYCDSDLRDCSEYSSVSYVGKRALGAAPLVTVSNRTLTIDGRHDSKVSVRVINMSGKIVAKYKLKSGTSVNLRKVPAGSYIVEALRLKDNVKASVKVTFR